MSYGINPRDSFHSSGNWSTATILGLYGRAFLLNTLGASTAWPANNDAYLIPFYVDFPIEFDRMAMGSGTTPGTSNFDLGIYNEGFARLRSIGATASTNNTDVMLPTGGAAFLTGPITLSRGRYYMAMSAASTALTVRANLTTNGVPRALGMWKMASAHPLPTTFTPASMGTTAFIPNIVMLHPDSTIL